MRIEPGQSLLHYRIVEKLGEGGMGQVFLAEDTKLKRKVALKILPERLARDRERLERFQREAEAVAALDHPNIVTIHSIDEADGIRFLTMSLAEGQPLDRMIPDSGVDLITFFSVSIPLSEALVAAHERGITHRDVKPANVMVAEDGRVRVLDFGLAKLQGPTSGDSDVTTMLTSDGLVMGTVPYMSPEQVTAAEIDHRTDVFSLGVVLYEMAAGNRPFAGESAAHIISAILRDTPKPIGEMRHDLPRQLGRIIQHCLAKDPEQRFQSVKDVRNELCALRAEVSSGGAIAAETTAIGAVARETTGSSPARRRSALAWILVAAVGLTIALGAWWLRDARPGGVAPSAAGTPGSRSAAAREADPRPGIAVLPLTNLSGDPEKEYFADGMTETLITDLAKIGGLRVISRGSVMRYKKSGKGIPEIAGELDVDYVLEGSVLLVGDRVRITTQLIHAEDDAHVWAENYEESLEDILSVQGGVARAVADEVRVQLTPQEQTRLSAGMSVDPEAYRLYLRGRFHWNERTIEGFERGLGYFRMALDKDRSFALAWAGMADAYTLLGEYSALPPADAFGPAMDAVRKALELDEMSGEAHATLGELLHYHEFDYERSEQALLRAIELAPSYATAYHWYSDLLAYMGRFDEGLEVVERAVELDPHSPIIRVSRALLLVEGGNVSGALEAIRDDIAREPDFWMHHWALAMARIAAGDWAEAASAAEQAVEVSGGHLWARAIFAFALGKAGRDEEVREIVTALRTLATRRYVSPTWLAVAELGTGDLDRVFETLEHAASTRDPMAPVIMVWPIFAELRDDPRYDELLVELGIAAATLRRENSRTDVDSNESSELTETQLTMLRESLERLRDELIRLLQTTREGTRPVSLDEPIGRLTRMDAMQQQGMAAANRRAHDLRLRQVRQALTLMARGDYGVCRRCEEPIGYRRLEARPESPYCLECQDAIDVKHGG